MQSKEYMSTVELKNRLIEKIHSTNDQQVLMDVIRLMNINLVDMDIEEPFKLTNEMNQAIDKARNQIKKVNTSLTRKPNKR